jgi:GDP-mannose 6-dehydrogenase
VNASPIETRVAVLGLGYVGSVTRGAPDAPGRRPRAPFYEPGLAELIREGRANGRLSATTLLEPAIEQAEVALICVGTPSERNGNLELDQLRRVCSQIATAWKGESRQLILAVRSTLVPGTREEVTAVPGLRSLRGSV